MEPAVRSLNGQHTLVDAMILFATSGVSSSRAIQIRARTYSSLNQLLSPVTRCRQSLCGCAQSLRTQCKHIDKRIYFSSHVSAWGIRRKSSECGRSGICAYEPSRAKSTEFLDELSARCSRLLVELTESLCQFSCRSDLSEHPSFRNSSLAWRAWLIHLNTEM
jgi:hypothetical protein